jgi:hypothetical protein
MCVSLYTSYHCHTVMYTESAGCISLPRRHYCISNAGSVFLISIIRTSIYNDVMKVSSVCNFIMHIYMNYCHLSIYICKKEFNNIQQNSSYQT